MAVRNNANVTSTFEQALTVVQVHSLVTLMDDTVQEIKIS